MMSGSVGHADMYRLVISMFQNQTQTRVKSRREEIQYSTNNIGRARPENTENAKQRLTRTHTLPAQHNPRPIPPKRARICLQPHHSRPCIEQPQILRPRNFGGVRPCPEGETVVEAGEDDAARSKVRAADFGVG